MRRVAIVISLASAAFIVLGALGGRLYVRGLASRAKLRIIRDLQERFNADVELKSLTLKLVPQPTVSGEGLSVRHRGWPEAHPLLSIARFSANATLVDVLSQRDRIDVIRLEGLEIHVPPRGKSAFVSQPAGGKDATVLRIPIHQIVADGALLEVEPRVPGKNPLRFPISKLSLWSVGPGRPLAFNADLQNARPPGIIKTNGSFGPWQKDDPRATQVSGTYAFSQADLSVFTGVSGTLSSQGSYNGTLQQIEVSGTTDTPDFALKRGGSPVHLRTTFHSVVDGGDGDTVLNPVQATFLHSTFVCRGGVIKLANDSHKTLDLYASANNARMEDILELVLGDKRRILTGTVNMQSKIVIPPGEKDVIDRLQLEGTFNLLSAQFASPKVEQRLATLSDRARGVAKSAEENQPPLTIASNMAGQFRLANGNVRFSRLSFDVPGAQVRLAGGYSLRNQQIDMKGVFRMDARLSQTQSGIKRWLLRPFDPMFEKDGAGFEVPLTVSGTRERPQVSAYALHHRFTLK